MFLQLNLVELLRLPILLNESRSRAAGDADFCEG
jgi:hypothetical protein